MGTAPMGRDRSGLARILTISGAIALAECFCHVASSDRVLAQITPDTTLGQEASVVSPNTTVKGLQAELIEGGALRGANLFHSFSQFNIGEGQRVYFANPAGIENILSRVTGNTLSNIFGTLGVDGTANLFLLNPNGITFGANAKLDIAGSFVASTANRLVFDNGATFSATNPEAPPLLSINLTPGLQYGSNYRGAITNAGNLAVGAGETLTLHGGTVTNAGSLTATGGKVQVLGDRIGLVDNARIDVSAPGGGGTVLIGGDFQGQGNLPNATQTFIGSNASINADAIGNGNGGKVIIWSDAATHFYGNISARGGANAGNGGFVEVSGKQFLDYNGLVDTRAPMGLTGTLLLDPTNIEVVAFGGETNNLGDADAFSDANLGTPGDTRLNVAAINNATANVILQATNDITFNANVNIRNPGIGLTAQAGNNIVVNRPITTQGGAIQLLANDASSGVASGTGSIFINANIQSIGGSIALRAGGDISVNGANVQTKANVIGNSGDLSIETGRLTVQNSGTLSTGTFGIGDAGNINIQANEIDLIAPASPLPRLTGITAISNPGSTGNAGIITIETGRLTAQNGAQVTAGTVGSGRAGSINVRASEIELIGVLSANGFPSGLLADSSVGSTGDAGTITIETGRLITRDGGGVFVSTESFGNGGELKVKASSIELSGRGSVYPGGLIAQAFPSSTGNAGQVRIDTERLLVQDRAQITTGASSGRAGNQIIQATQSVDVLNKSILNAVSDGAGAGGDIAISTKNLTLQEGFIFTGTSDRGNAGSVAISSLESIKMAGLGSISTSALGSGVGGNLLIETGTLTISDEASILSSSFGQGNAGNQTIRATSTVNITGSGLISTGSFGTGTGGTMEIETGQMLVSGQAEVSSFSVAGNAGNLTIRTGQLQVRDEAIVATGTDVGNAGNLTIQATDFVNLLDGGSLLAISTATGSGGTITIDTRNITLQNGGQIGTTTIDRGNAGSIAINSPESVTVSGNTSTISALSFGSGTGGNLSINTGTLTIRDGGSIVTSTVGQGSAGNLIVNAANAINVIESGVLSTGTLGTGAGGNLSIATRNLNIQNSGKVFTSSLDASTFDFSIFAPNLYPPDGIERARNSVNTASQGNFTQGDSGNLIVNATDSVNVSDSGILSTLARGRATGGNLSIQTQKLSVQNQGTIATDTSGSGNAGPLTVNASDSVEVANFGSNITTQSLPDSTGNGGKLAIVTGQLVIRDDAAVSSATFGQGLGGDVQLQANSLSLTNSGRITSRSEGSSNAGNITMNVRDALQSSTGNIIATATQAGGGSIDIVADDIRLDNSSLISTSVLDSTGGGGNITINSIIFLALEDSDILANANAGPGGNITIKSPGFLADLFSTGQAEAVGRNPGDFAQFRGNGRVDISAESQTGPSGTVTYPNVDPTQGAAELPSELVDASEQIDRRCTPSGSAQGSSFTVVGRGGLPPNPNDPLMGESIITNWVALDSEPAKRDRTDNYTYPSSTPSKQLVEAQGWAIGVNGQVMLTAQANTATPVSPGVLPVTCPDSREAKD